MGKYWQNIIQNTLRSRHLADFQGLDFGVWIADMWPGFTPYQNFHSHFVGKILCSWLNLCDLNLNLCDLNLDTRITSAMSIQFQLGPHRVLDQFPFGHYHSILFTSVPRLRKINVITLLEYLIFKDLPNGSSSCGILSMERNPRE